MISVQSTDFTLDFELYWYSFHYNQCELGFFLFWQICFYIIERCLLDMFYVDMALQFPGVCIKACRDFLNSDSFYNYIPHFSSGR